MKMNRRSFMKGTAVLGTALAAGKTVDVVAKNDDVLGTYLPEEGIPDLSDTSPDVELIYSVCLQCHSACTIRGKLKDGKILKIDGSPYSPMTYDQPLPYDTDPKEAAKYRGRLCARGQAGIQTAYDPLRVKEPLKRVGPRGSGKWKTISWEQAYKEIVEGGDLFNEGHVDGLRAIRDTNTLIDPSVPEFGPKSNQFVFLAGRIEEGRKEFSKRFLNGGYGSVNWFEHTSICEISHHIATKQTTPDTDHFKPDFANANYIISFGAAYVEANFPMNNLANKVGQFKERGGRLIVVEPRLSLTAAKADRWIPVKPGGDGALALGMIRWIIENERYDKHYLENTTKESATQDGEPTWSDATYLVRLDTKKFLRADEAGLGGTKDDFVVLVNGSPAIHNKVPHGDLEGGVTVNGIECKTSFSLLKEEVMRYSLKEYAELSGIEENIIIQTANEFTSYGKKAVADFYRGPVKHTNGYHNGRAIIVLNLLIGNFDWKGGYTVGGGHLHEMGGKENTKYNLDSLHPNKTKTTGVPITREKSKYEESTEFKKNGYPAKRPWFPFTSNLFQEVIAGIADEYPYPIKALFLHMGTPAYSSPGMKDITIKTLSDTKKVPLFLACDIVIGDTSMYADYILPDVTYLERWGTPHTAPTIISQVSKVRQPMTKVYKNTKSLEEILIDLAKLMDLPGFGDNGFGPGMPLNKPEDWYLKMVANYAYEGKVPGLTEEEKIKYVLDRGGVFDDPKNSYDGNYIKKQYGGIVHVYSEQVGSAKHSITGEYFNGLPTYEPIKDLKGKEIKDEDYPFTLITYKFPIHTQARTVTNPWLMEILPENFVDINTDDAKSLGIKSGDMVRIISVTNKKGEVGKARLLQGIRPGVVAVSASYGHWASGAEKSTVDGKTFGNDKKRKAGINPNPVMRLDTSIGNVCLEDPIGGSACFGDTKIKILKV